MTRPPKTKPKDWNPLADRRRKRSEDAASRAERAWTQGNDDEARKLFAKAAVLEQAVAENVPPAMERLRSILALSAVSLWYKAGQLGRAKGLAYQFLAAPKGLTEQGRCELERVVDRCLREAELGRVTSDPGMVPVDVKLDGGRIGRGIAPEAAARKRRDAVVGLLRRTAEHEAKVPYRERGESDLERNDQIQLYEVPALAASYALRFYVATGTQQKIPSEQPVTPTRVVERFLELAETAARGPEAIRETINDSQYSSAFLAGFAELTPDGIDVATVACSAPSWRIRAPSMVFKTEHRSPLRAAATATAIRESKPGERRHDGKLLTFHLTRTESWVEMELPGLVEPKRFPVVDKKLRTRIAASIGDADADLLVCVFVRYSPKAHDWVVTDVFTLGRATVPPAQAK